MAYASTGLISAQIIITWRGVVHKVLTPPLLKILLMLWESAQAQLVTDKLSLQLIQSQELLL